MSDLSERIAAAEAAARRRRPPGAPGPRVHDVYGSEETAGDGDK